MLEKRVENDKIEIVGDYKTIQIRNATIISENGKELSRTFHRYAIHSDMDISGEGAEIQAICNSVWTPEVKQKWADFQASQER